MTIPLIIILILLGLVCVLLDILVIPGGIVAIIGSLMMIAGVIISYFTYNSFTGNVILISTLFISIASIILILRSKTWKKMMLNTNIDSKVNEFNAEKIIVGAEGISISRLAPMGKAKFNGEIVEVTSPYGFIDNDKELVIIQIEDNKIFVKLK